MIIKLNEKWYQQGRNFYRWHARKDRIRLILTRNKHLHFKPKYYVDDLPF